MAGSEENKQVTIMVYAALELLLAVVVIGGNCLVITTIIKFQKMRTITNALIFNLALADMFVGVTLPYHVMFHAIPALHTVRVACIFLVFSMLLSCTASILTVLAISAERYVAIVYPLRYPAIMTAKVNTFALVGVWTYAIVNASALFFWNKFDERKGKCVLINVMFLHHQLLLMHLPFLMVCATVLCIYLRIFLEARKHRRQIWALEQRGNAAARVERESKTTQTLAIVVGVFFLCWIPYNVIMLIQSLSSPTEFTNTIYSVFLITGIINSCMNPVIYAWKNKEFKSAFKLILHCSQENSSSS